jgi:hypothetical protein
VGYSLTPEVVTENKDLIAKILNDLRAGRETAFPEVPGLSLSKMQYHISRVLKAAELYGDSEEVRGLRSSVKVSLDTTTRSVILHKKLSATTKEFFSVPATSLQSEYDMIERLDTYKGTMMLAEFKPTPDFDEEEFVALVAEKGWTVHTQTRREIVGGLLSYAFERIEEERSMFSTLTKRYNSAR